MLFYLQKTPALMQMTQNCKFDLRHTATLRWTGVVLSSRFVRLYSMRCTLRFNPHDPKRQESELH